MTRSLLALALASTLVMVACGGEPIGQRSAKPATLADLLRAKVALVLDAENGRLTLSYQPFAYSCMRLGEDAHATVNGEPLSVVSRGYGFADGELGPSGDRCTRPFWAVPERAATEAVTSFEVKDNSATLQADYENAWVARSASVHSPDSGVVSPGQHVEVAWAPETDTPYVRSGNSFTMGLSFQPADGGVSSSWGTATDSARGRLGFDVPTGARGTGTLWFAGRFDYGVARCEPSTLTCSGFGRTNGSMPGQVSLRITIVP